MVTPAAKREAVAHLRSAFDMSERRACRTINCERMTMRYRSRRPDDTELRQRLRALAHERRRFGYRRLHVLLRRSGEVVNHKRVHRVYREAGLALRRKKRKRFTEEQIIGVLREHELGAKTADLCRKHGISEATFYNWKSKFGGLDVSEARRLKQLEGENARLKKLLADSMLDNAALKDLLSKKW